jgi:DNA-binding transcriptional LysR family regulator
MLTRRRFLGSAVAGLSSPLWLPSHSRAAAATAAAGAFQANWSSLAQYRVPEWFRDATKMIAPLPEESVQPYIESGDLTVLIEDLGLEIGSFGIIVRRGYKLSPGAQIMLTALRETAAKLYSSEPNAGSD